MVSQSSILTLALGPRLAGMGAAFSRSLDNSLADVQGAREKVFQRYGVQEQDDAKGIQSIHNSAQDAVFYDPAVALAKAWSGPAYMYHFNEPNLSDGPWNGRASRLTDIRFAFHNFDDYLTDAQRAVCVSRISTAVPPPSDIRMTLKMAQNGAHYWRNRGGLRP